MWRGRPRPRLALLHHSLNIPHANRGRRRRRIRGWPILRVLCEWWGLRIRRSPRSLRDVIPNRAEGPVRNMLLASSTILDRCRCHHSRPRQQRFQTAPQRPPLLHLFLLRIPRPPPRQILRRRRHHFFLPHTKLLLS